MRMSGGHLPRQSRRKHRNSRDAFRTLRRIPLVVSRTASPRPLPSCRSSRASTNTEVSQRLRRPGWAPIHRSGSPHIRPIDARTHRNGTSNGRSHQITRRRANVSCGTSASRLSSTDESVTSFHRCQRHDVLFFHGLCSPSRYIRTRSYTRSDASPIRATTEIVRIEKKLRCGPSARRTVSRTRRLVWSQENAEAPSTGHTHAVNREVRSYMTAEAITCSRIGRLS